MVTWLMYRHEGYKKQIWILFEKATFVVGHLSCVFVRTDFRQITVITKHTGFGQN